jgi:gliding motility-associated-like protein
MTYPKFLFCRLLLLLLLLLALSSTAVIGQETFVKFYRQDGGSSMDDAVLLSSDRLVLVGRSFDPASGLTEARVLTLDGAGEVVTAQKLFLGSNQVAPFVSWQSATTFSLGINGFGGALTGGFLYYRMSTESGQLSGLRWDASFEQVTVESSVTLPGGDVVSVGSVRDSPISVRAFLTRVRNDGVFVFQKVAGQPGGGRSSFTSVKLLSDGSLLIFGKFIGNERGVVVLKVDSAGNLLWEKKYVTDVLADSRLKQFAVFPDDTFAFSLLSSGNTGPNRWPITVFIRCDEDGEIQASNAYGIENYLEFGHLLPRPNGNLLVAGLVIAPNASSNFALIAELDPQGNVLRQRTYQVENGVRFRKIIPWLNGEGYYLIGDGRQCPRGQTSMMIVSVDKDLNPPVDACLESLDFTITSEIRETMLLNEEILFGDVDFTSGSAPGFDGILVEARNLICFQLALNVSSSTDTFCYQQPTDLQRTLSISQNTDVNLDSTVLTLSGPDGNDYLSAPGNTSQLLNNNGTARLRLLADGLQPTDAIREVVSNLRFGNTDGTPATGLRTVTITAHYDCARTETVDFSFYVYGPSGPVIKLPADTIVCPGEALSLSAQDEGATAYRWSNGAETPTTVITGAGDYSVVVSSPCRTDTFRVTVAFGEVPETEDRTEQLFACLGDSVSFEPFIATETSARWRDDFPTPDRTFYGSGSFQLIQSTACAEAITTVNVAIRSCCEVYLPNAFSPNGDGVNDDFRALPARDGCAAVRDFTLRVYDRWGGEVYRGDGLTGWDGSVSGDGKMDAGVFAYVVEYFDGAIMQQRSGMLSLLR